MKKVLGSIGQFIYISLPKLIPGYFGKRFRAESAEKLAVIDELDTNYGKIKFYCFGARALYRSKTFFIKEPETLSWIDKMETSDTLWDIGANVGLYSIYAGRKGLRVFAFEPSSLNTFLISRNVEINDLKNNVFLFPIAVSDKNEFGYLNMTSVEYGGALSEFSKSDIEEVGDNNYQAKVIFKQGMFSYSIDELIEKYKFKIPSYIKIDVDNIEDKIIFGAKKTLSDKRLKGLLVELDESTDIAREIITLLKENGFELIEKKHSEMFESGKFNSIYNHIFERAD